MRRVLFPPFSVLATVGLCLLASAAEPVSHPEPARTKGWSWKVPPDQVKPDSGKRSHVFYVSEPVSFKLGGAAATFEVRDYCGDLVDQGAAGDSVTLKVKDPGWYKLYVYGKETRKEWGDIVGTTNFVIFRNDPNFPPLPPRDVPGGSYPSMDEPMRGVLGMGPQRLAAQHLDKLDQMIVNLAGDVALDAKYYLPFDPVRKRALMVAFPNGTKDKLDAVRTIVERFKKDVRYWEPRNEPNFGSSGADFVANEMKGFYETVKSVDPGLKVMGPGTVSIGPQLQGWIEDFFKSGGGRYIDVFSFHIYNGINGDLFLGRKTMDNLQATLARFGLEKIEKWQTEQGYFAAVYGSYQPRMQGRWTMLEMMLFEQYGIPKEHNHLWYDRSHGFWDFPTWWENEDGSLNPAAPLMRVWAEELYDTNFAKAFDFGKDGNKLYLGSLFTGEGKSVAAFMNAGCGRPDVALRVTGGEKLRVVSPFGVVSEIPVRNGVAKITVPEIPVYVELAQGQTVEPVPQNWGTNLARTPGVTVSSSGTGAHPVDKNIPNSITKIHNGEYENWYWAQTPAAQEWMDDTKELPAWVELRLPAPVPVARVVVFCGTPWQWRGTFVDYELQYEKDGQWATLERVKEPLKTFGVYSPPTRTTVDSFFADRWIFEHSFAPVTTGKIRLLVHEVTWGQGATSIVPEAGGQTGPHQICLREVEVYGPPPPASVRAGVPSSYLTQAFAKQPVTVTVANASNAPVQTTARISVPEGWKAEPAERPMAPAVGESASAAFDLFPPAEIPAGPVSVQITLSDARGTVLDKDTLTLRVFAPVDLTPLMPETFDEKKQELQVLATNLSKEPVESTLKLRVTELAPQGKVFAQERKVSLPPFEKVSVPFTVPDVNLTGSGWRIAYSLSVGPLASTATQDIAIRAWMVVGPFANDFEKEFGPEKKVDLSQTYAVLGGPAPAGWKQVNSALNGHVDLVKAYEKQPHENCCAYAVIYVKSPTARKALFSAGSDDGVRAWLNGKQIVSNNVARGAAPGQEKVTVDLNAGWNELLMKITQGGGGWGLYADFLTPDGQPLPDLIYAPRKP